MTGIPQDLISLRNKLISYRTALASKLGASGIPIAEATQIVIDHENLVLDCFEAFDDWLDEEPRAPEMIEQFLE